MTRKKIVVVGSVNVDFAVHAPRLPVEGETVSRAKFDIFFGGKGGNQAVAAAKLGVPTSIIARIGDDEFGKQLRRSLREAGVNVHAVQTARKVHTGTAFVITDHRGANQIVVAPGANAALGVADLVRNRSLLRSAGLILAQLEIPQTSIAKLAEMTHEFGVPFILDPAPARKLPLGLLRRVSILTPNETEACFLTGRKPKRLDCRTGAQLCRRLLKLGPRIVILKLGGQGALVAEYGREVVHVPGFQVKTVDTTAAGDAFNGALAVALLEDASVPEAVRFANAAAALSVTKQGAQPSLPTRRAVLSFLRRHQQAR